MEEIFDGLVAVIKAFFRVVYTGQSQILTCLTNLVADHPGFFAFYLEISIIALILMGRLLIVRKQQREMPVPPPAVTVSPVVPDPLPPDQTVRNESLKIAGIFIVIVAIFALIAYGMG